MGVKRYLLIISAFLFLVFCCKGVVIASSFPPLPEALSALESDEDVTVREVLVNEWPEGSNFYYTFESTIHVMTIGFIIYPGALVDPRSYAPFAHEIARYGFLTVIVKMVDDLALGESVQRATKIISDYPEIEKWAIGGHSMGGFGACVYTKDHTEDIDGVVLWAAYPSDFARLNDRIIKALSIYGTNDGLVTLDEIDDSRDDLPPYTQWVAVVGGNHTQFGCYDTSPYPIQPDDNPAGITRQEQQDIIVQATVDFLDYFNLCPSDPDNDYDNDTVCGDVDNCPSLANLDQLDNYPPQGNGIGDACDCEGNFNCDANLGSDDVSNFISDTGRNLYNNRCTNANPCNGDFGCDGSVDSLDVSKFLEDTGRNTYNNPCPTCDPEVPWCTYP